MKENRLFYRYLYILFVFGILVSVKGLSVERIVVLIKRLALYNVPASVNIGMIYFILASTHLRALTNASIHGVT